MIPGMCLESLPTCELPSEPLKITDFWLSNKKRLDLQERIFSFVSVQLSAVEKVHSRFVKVRAISRAG